MAKGRFISKSLSQSDKFAALSCNDHRLMYTMLLPHVDRDGRHEAKPRLLGGVVFTYLDFSEEQIQNGLDDLAKVGLIQLYWVDGSPYLEIVDFLEHNSPNAREAASKIPPPTDERATHGLFADKSVKSTDKSVKGLSEVEVEVKGRGSDASANLASEQVADEIMRHGPNPAHEINRVRAKLRRLNADFAKQHEQSLINWIHHSDADLERLWEASHPEKWTDTEREGKRRSWNFLDLLSGEIVPPRSRESPVTAASLREQLIRKGTLEA